MKTLTTESTLAEITTLLREASLEAFNFSVKDGKYHVFLASTKTDMPQPVQLALSQETSNTQPEVMLLEAFRLYVLAVDLARSLKSDDHVLVVKGLRDNIS